MIWIFALESNASKVYLYKCPSLSAWRTDREEGLLQLCMGNHLFPSSTNFRYSWHRTVMWLSKSTKRLSLVMCLQLWIVQVYEPRIGIWVSFNAILLQPSDLDASRILISRRTSLWFGFLHQLRTNSIGRGKNHKEWRHPWELGSNQASSALGSRFSKFSWVKNPSATLDLARIAQPNGTRTSDSYLPGNE